MSELRSGERGQVTVLVLGLALVAFAAAGLAVDGTRAFMLRRTLQNTADSAASAAAATLDRSSIYQGEGIDIDPRRAEESARAMLERRALPRETTVQIRVTTEEVDLIIRSEMPTSFLGLLGLDRVPVAVTAEAAPFASD